MAFDVLALSLLISGVVLAYSASTAARAGAPVLLPPEDQPPDASFPELPWGRPLDGYVGRGLSEIDSYLGQKRDEAV